MTTLTRPSPRISRREVGLENLKPELASAIRAGRRLGLMTAIPHVACFGSEKHAAERETPCFSEPKHATSNLLSLVTLVLNPSNGSAEVWETPLPEGTTSFPSITRDIPQAHWFERGIYDFFGLKPEGHPRFKSVILHEAWPDGFHPLAPGAPDRTPDGPPRKYEFFKVTGEGVYEIPVGPIHAGIIEPGHFRFSCLGEVIQNLEIRLGYQHRGVERKLTEVPWQRGRFYAEAASSDTTVGNALAHTLAIEQILGIDIPDTAATYRAVALEIERIASHIGDLGGLSSDIGYAAGAAIFGRMRGRALGIGERLAGSRFMTGYVLPGGVARFPDDDIRLDMIAEARAIAKEFDNVRLLIEDNAGVLERMEGIGIVKPSLAADFGLVGPAGRASGVDYDIRRDFGAAPYTNVDWKVAKYSSGDVLARAQVRIREVEESLKIVIKLLDAPIPPLLGARGHSQVPSLLGARGPLPPNAVGMGIVEAWRGELIHLVFTDANGLISRYAIKDPSFNNWTGLAIAGRGQLVADFPLCNKSFSLSYSGNDL